MLRGLCRRHNPAMDLKQKFGRQIRAVRKAKGLTQEQVAELIDRSTRAVSDLERGKSLPRPETLVVLSERLEVPLRSFFDFEVKGAGDPKRADLLAEIDATVHQLDNRELEIVVQQAKGLLSLRKRES